MAAHSLVLLQATRELCDQKLWLVVTHEVLQKLKKTLLRPVAQQLEFVLPIPEQKLNKAGPDWKLLFCQ